MTHTNNNWILLALALGFGAALGCGDEATIVAPEPPTGAAGSSTGTAGTGGTGGNGSAGTSAGGTAGTANTACVEDPVAPADFLVRCTDSACRPFDNTERLGLFRAGEPLPEVP
jgi:hypothetical protein